MTHPLTDDHISAIFDHDVDLEDQMRLAYDKGRNEQLEQVIAWLKDNLQSWYLDPSGESGYKINVNEVVSDLEEAMCPQENS
jgi:hypothetical protein